MEKPKPIKKENPKSSKTTNKKKQQKRQDKQFKWMFILMISLILIVILVPLITYSFINKFTLFNLEFRKTKQGTLTLYQTQIPVKNNLGAITGNYLMTFKNDPRETVNIKISPRIEKDGIKFVNRNTVYISLDPSMNPCSDNSVSMFVLGDFLSSADLSVKSAFIDKNYSEESGFPYKTCEDSSKNTVIIVKSGNESMINQERTNCYEVIYKDCEINQVVERFILEIVKDYMKDIDLDKQ